MFVFHLTTTTKISKSRMLVVSFYLFQWQSFFSLFFLIMDWKFSFVLLHIQQMPLTLYLSTLWSDSLCVCVCSFSGIHLKSVPISNLLNRFRVSSFTFLPMFSQNAINHRVLLCKTKENWKYRCKLNEILRLAIAKLLICLSVSFCN